MQLGDKKRVDPLPGGNGTSASEHSTCNSLDVTSQRVTSNIDLSNHSSYNSSLSQNDSSDISTCAIAASNRKISDSSICQSDFESFNNKSSNINIINDSAIVARLCIHDKTDHTKYLIDTGADVSVVPFSSFVKPNISVRVPKLYAANGSAIKTYGVLRKQVNLDMRRDFTWNFIIADVKQPIIGVDFLSEFNLLVDVKNNV